jgi:hypothetical protein
MIAYNILRLWSSEYLSLYCDRVSQKLIVLLPFFFWSLYCLSFYLRLLIINPLAPSNFTKLRTLLLDDYVINTINNLIFSAYIIVID